MRLAAGLVAAHAVVVLSAFARPAAAQGDVELYGQWAATVLGGGDSGADAPWVYPVAALLPMVVAGLVAPGGPGFVVAWVLLVVVLDAVAVVVLSRHGAVGQRAAWWWVAAIAATGPAWVFRLDGVVAPLVVLALVRTTSRPALAGAVVGVAAWVKVWPGALVVVTVLALRGRRLVQHLAGALAAGLAGLAAAVVLAPTFPTWGFLTTQFDRPLQVEAVAATPLLWARSAGQGPAVRYDDRLSVFVLDGAAADTVAAGCAVVMPVALAGACLLLRARLRGADVGEVVTAGALLLAAVLVVTNKVGSAQFVTWLVPPVAVALATGRPGWRAPAVLVLGAAAATHLVFPLTYGGLVDGAVLPTLLQTTRSLLLVATLAWAVRQVHRAGRPDVLSPPSRRRQRVGSTAPGPA